MNVTKDLMNEHQLILSYIQLFKEYVAQSTATSGDVLLEKGILFIDFIQNFADRFHHAKEEEILFKHMETDGVLTHCNPLPQMLHEHEEGRAAVRIMLNALEASDPVSFSQAAIGYATLLEEHIYKEDTILYQMAEDGLTDEQKSLVYSEYVDVEGRMQAEDIWEHYKTRLLELRDYLNTRTHGVAV